MEELKTEIGLTADDISIIIYTSLDAENLNDLICLNGEFLKWFSTKFSGDNRNELDFLVTKLDIWTSTVTLSREILAEADKV